MEDDSATWMSERFMIGVLIWLSLLTLIIIILLIVLIILTHVYHRRRQDLSQKRATLSVFSYCHIVQRVGAEL